MAIGPADLPEKIISAIGPYPADLTSFKSYDDAFAHNTLYPEHGRIRELLESALSVGAEVTKVEAEKKHADKADRAWVNVGKEPYKEAIAEAQRKQEEKIAEIDRPVEIDDDMTIYNIIREIPDTYRVFPFELLIILTTFAINNKQQIFQT